MVEPITRHRPGARRAPTSSGCASGAGPEVEILAATKYVPREEMGALAEAGVSWSARTACRTSRRSTSAGATRFTWDFIGNLQSRKVKRILPLVRLIHSVATDSVLEQLGRHGDAGHRGAGRGQRRRRGGQGRGRARRTSATFIERCPVRVVGLMTMPPFTEDPEASRPHFARLAELAAEHGLERLSMGTSQDWRGRGRGGGDDHPARAPSLYR